MSSFEDEFKHDSVITDSDDDIDYNSDDDVFDKEEFARRTKALDARFPNAQFVVSCFRTVDEIETKVLTDEDTILYTDCYLLQYLNNKTNECVTEDYQDFFILHKQKDQPHIRYCDVIDAMIANNFERNKGRHKLLESI